MGFKHLRISCKKCGGTNVEKQLKRSYREHYYGATTVVSGVTIKCNECMHEEHNSFKAPKV